MVDSHVISAEEKLTALHARLDDTALRHVAHLRRYEDAIEALDRFYNHPVGVSQACVQLLARVSPVKSSDDVEALFNLATRALEAFERIREVNGHYQLTTRDLNLLLDKLPEIERHRAWDYVADSGAPECPVSYTHLTLPTIYSV